MHRPYLPSFARHPYFWLPPIVALPLLWPLADTVNNHALFLTLNGLAALLPDWFWSDATVLGDTLVALCLALPLVRRRPDLVVAALLASLPATLISHGLKDALDMARPFAVLGNAVHVIGPHLTAGSFPSGHTTTAFVLASVLAAGLNSRSAALGVLMLALLVGMARIAVGAHWPMDIAGGMLCGWVSALIGLFLARRYTHPGHVAVRETIRFFLIACALYLFVHYDSGYPLARPFEQALSLGVLVYHLLPGWPFAKHTPDSC
jgi:membrane-associated phospholipid phosphatase